MISVEKIGGTSMSAFGDVLRHIMLYDPKRIYGRIYVVSAYSGVTNQLLEHKKTGERGIYALFAESKGYQDALNQLATSLKKINAGYADLGLPLSVADAFIDHRIPSTAKWEFTPEGQHIELGIAEMNLMLMLGAAGLSHSLFGERLIPIGTVYDPFVVRGLDALNYACYQNARFMLIGTPSGVTLAPEGGAHQSIGTPLIGMAQDGLAAFEPAFFDELSVIMDWSFDYLQRDGEGDPDERTWLRDETGGSVYLRLSTRPVEQPLRRVDPDFAQSVIDGAYWLREPGPNADVVVVYQGTVATEAIVAAGRIAEGRRDVGVLAVTSADRLNAGWTAAQRARARGHRGAVSLAERLMGRLPAHCTLITVIDGHPATLSWLGAVGGHRTVPLGVEHFGQTGTIADLYHHFGIDADAIVSVADRISPGKPIRLRA